MIIPEIINVDGEDIPVKAIAYNAFNNNNTMISVTIPDSVTTIGYSAFDNCSNLETVTFGENSQLTTIGDYAFYNCDSLNSIFIPDSVTTIGYSAFYNCSNLTIYCEASSEPEGWDYYWNSYYYPEVWSSYLGINGILDGLKYAVCIDDVNSRYLTITGYTGTNPKLIIPSSINVNGEDIPIKVITNNAFVNNETITSVNIPSNVVIIDNYAFAGCSSLYEVIIEENTQLISLGWSSFAGCSSLTSIYIPDSVTTIGGNAFRDCSSLTTIYIPDSVISINLQAFLYCSNLTIYCEASSQPSGWSEYWNFSNRPVIWNSYKGIYGNLNGLEYISNLDNESNPYITITGYTGSSANVVIPSLINVNGGVIPVKAIGRRAFYNNKTITSVVIPDSVATIGSSAFSGCSNLTTVTISENRQLTSIGYNAFSGCSSLTSIYIPDSVTTIGEYAFVSCSNLTIVTISENSQLTTIGEYAFSDCSSLTSIYIPDSVTTIEEFVFYNYSKLTIYCEASSEPSGWAYTWNNFSNSSHFLKCPVVWNCTYDEYLEAIA